MSIAAIGTCTRSPSHEPPQRNYLRKNQYTIAISPTTMSAVTAQPATRAVNLSMNLAITQTTTATATSTSMEIKVSMHVPPKEPLTGLRRPVFYTQLKMTHTSNESFYGMKLACDFSRTLVTRHGCSQVDVSRTVNLANSLQDYCIPGLLSLF